ncbi:hypothetical protein JMJ35_007048 [Cladonia borealis]|uniref:High-temperature-induced dauer-formation protein n=1 Tax=Cladonia borealis TaxID=184061 RepID=A0AA39QY64_9LECA|nr:hypothetical protein JMJ35_007048 [Cladonia borealis]
MGNSDSKLVFKQGIFKLSEANVIPASDPYWRGFWELPESSEDVFSLFSPVDVRRARDSSLPNIETLIIALTTRLFTLRQHRSFPNPENAPEKHALNCMRVLTRILPFLYEADHLEEWEDKFFWAKRKRKSKGQAAKTEVLFDESQNEEPNKEIEHFEDVRPLGEELVDTLVDMLFYIGFTLPITERSRNKVTYAIWQKGVGSNNSMPTSNQLESNRTEVLRLLLTLSSKSLYMPAHILPIKGVKAVTYITTCPDKQLVLSLLCSQLNTALNYNPATWRVPYDHMVYRDPKQILISYCLQFLLVLILYPIPEEGGGSPSKNYFRHFLGRLHRPQDFEFLADGMTRTLNQPLQATSSYLPGSQKSVKWASEMIMLFWETLQCNKRFRSFIIDTDRGHEFMALIIFYAMEYKTDPSKQGVVRMCVFVLQTLSTEPNFGRLLNQDIETQDSLPSTIKLDNFRGTYGDFLIISIHTLITSSKGKLDAIYPSLLATINNIAPYAEHLNAQASSKLLQLFASMSSPSFLLANETNYSLLQSLLESMNAIIEHQYRENKIFIQGIFRYRKRFEALRSFTLESGQLEIERMKQLRKDAADAVDAPNSPGRASRNSSVDSVRSPHGARVPSLSNVPEEGGAFAIGDDDDSGDENQEMLATPSQSSPSAHDSPSRNASISSLGDEPLPTQLRGMSEKARGKMPVGQSTFSRQNSTTSLNSHPAALMSPTSSGFDPTAHWIDSWLPNLPLHTILTLLSSSSPPKDLPAGLDPTPPRVHLFEWTPLALGWYESLLWGFIFASEMVVQKGTVGVWNGTSIRLFKVETVAARGPSLTKPMGAVDAVGSRLVSGVASLGIGRRDASGGEVGGGGRGMSVRDV